MLVELVFHNLHDAIADLQSLLDEPLRLQSTHWFKLESFRREGYSTRIHAPYLAWCVPLLTNAKRRRNGAISRSVYKSLPWIDHTTV